MDQRHLVYLFFLLFYNIKLISRIQGLWRSKFYVKVHYLRNKSVTYNYLDKVVAAFSCSVLQIDFARTTIRTWLKMRENAPSSINQWKVYKIRNH